MIFLLLLSCFFCLEAVKQDVFLGDILIQEVIRAKTCREIAQAIRAEKGDRAQKKWIGKMLEKVLVSKNKIAFECLVDYGIDFEYGYFQRSTTALGLMASYGDAIGLKWLLEAKVNPNTPDQYGYTPLILSVKAGASATFDILVNYEGVNLDWQERSFLRSAMHFSMMQKGAFFKTLLDAGANPNLKDGDGNTVAFILAMTYDYDDLSYLLESERANFSQLNNQGLAPIHRVILNGSVKQLDLLLASYQVDPNIQGTFTSRPLRGVGDPLMYTAMHYAAEARSQSETMLLKLLNSTRVRNKLDFCGFVLKMDIYPCLIEQTCFDFLNQFIEENQPF